MAIDVDGNKLWKEMTRMDEEQYPKVEYATESGTTKKMTDPWEHRSEKMRCLSCMWYVRKKTYTPVGAASDEIVENVEIGRCRRRAPSMNGYPVVFGTDFCGDHKLDENKAQ